MQPRTYSARTHRDLPACLVLKRHAPFQPLVRRCGRLLAAAIEQEIARTFSSIALAYEIATAWKRTRSGPGTASARSVYLG